MFLADTSAWHRSRHPAVVDEWTSRLGRDGIGTTTPVRLEALYSARSAEHYEAIRAEFDALQQVPCDARAMLRAEEVQHLLARQHTLHHRSVKLIDLMIAAAAEFGGATVWHYDEDYDRIAELTGQPTRWLAPAGSLR